MNPSPQIEWKLQSEDLDPIHRSAFLRRVLGPDPRTVDFITFEGMGSSHSKIIDTSTAQAIGE